MDVISLLPALLIVAGVIYLIRRSKRADRRVHDLLQEQTEDILESIEDPNADPALLRKYLTMPIPRDERYEYHMLILRSLAQNPSLPVELQAAALNRISSEEMTERLDKTLKKRGGGRSQGFIGMSQEISGD